MNFYLQRYAIRNELIEAPVSQNLNLIVVIPSFCEPDLITSLKSLYEANRPEAAVEIIVVINHGKNCPDEIKSSNIESFHKAKHWSEDKQEDAFKFFILLEELPDKDAGVGLARKIGMDEAVRRFEKSGSEDGVIICFDADSICEKNYLTEIERHFKLNPKTPGASINFEHPISGEFDSEIYEGIILYELYLRYYVLALRFAGHPFAFHTIGSSMAVRNSAYQSQGGMNKRKAGEDFYFLQKIIGLGNYSEIYSTKVIPSPRVSSRVPFGTGKAIGDFLKTKEFLFYDFRIFQDIKIFIEYIKIYSAQRDFQWEKIPESISVFLKENDFENVLIEIRNNTSSQEAFIKRFFKWFDGFKVLKLVHFYTDKIYPKRSFYETLKIPAIKAYTDTSLPSSEELLLKIRKN